MEKRPIKNGGDVSVFATVKKKILIAAHMGTHGSNIPGNTQAAFELALRQGADIIELDVTKSADDVLFVFHPKTEEIRLGMPIDIRTMPAAEVEKLHFVNTDMEKTSHTVTRLEEMLAFLKGRCTINIDKFFDNPLEIGKLVRDMHMQDQVIVKTPPTREFFDQVAETAGDLPFMPFVYDEDTCCDYLNARKDLRYSGAEVVYYEDSSMLASEAYIEKMHAMGKRVWINSIRFNDKRPLAGSRFDDVALCDDPDKVWGWMAERGYDIIQTDWVLPLMLYLRAKGY